MCQGEHWCARAQGVPAVPTPIRGWMGGKLWLSVPPGVLEVWAGQGLSPTGWCSSSSGCCGPRSRSRLQGQQELRARVTGS